MRSPEDIKAEIAEVQRKRAKRYGKPGLTDNIAHLDARLVELSAEIEAAGGS